MQLRKFRTNSTHPIIICCYVWFIPFADIGVSLRYLYSFFQVMISNLPDKGDKIRKQIAQLHSELENISSEARNKNNIIDLDEISG